MTAQVCDWLTYSCLCICKRSLTRSLTHSQLPLGPVRQRSRWQSRHRRRHLPARAPRPAWTGRKTARAPSRLSAACARGAGLRRPAHQALTVTTRGPWSALQLVRSLVAVGMCERYDGGKIRTFCSRRLVPFSFPSRLISPTNLQLQVGMKCITALNLNLEIFD